MKSFFSILTICLIAIGFIVPLAWGAAIVTCLLALTCAPPGRREDGKKKSGGLLGGLIDDIVISGKMRDCPHCCKKIMKSASKCPYCQEFVEITKNSLWVMK